MIPSPLPVLRLLFAWAVCAVVLVACLSYAMVTVVWVGLLLVFGFIVGVIAEARRMFSQG